MSEYEVYIGTKIIRARECSYNEFHTDSQIVVDRDGFEVIYGDGYVSWSPEEAFNAAYRRISDNEIRLIDS